MPPPSSHPALPAQGRRTYLRPIQGGPWLDDRETTYCSGTLALSGGVLALVSALMAPHPRALVGFWMGTFCIGTMLAVLCGLGFLASFFGRAATQTCPECLQDMRRGATTCPHCHFHPQPPPQGGTV
jgi:hypothetical protein